MTDEELKEQIAWFESLQEMHDEGNSEAVSDAIGAAIKLLEREKKARSETTILPTI